MPQDIVVGLKSKKFWIYQPICIVNQKLKT